MKILAVLDNLVGGSEIVHFDAEETFNNET